ncbi:MAG: SHOCT domain-containing protein [Acidimicrobiales bacterium]|jgi:hypothetical protein
MMRRRPLLRAAAIGGVAYVGAKAGTNRAIQNQQQAAAAPGTPPAATAPASPAVADTNDRIAQLQQLANLHTQGVLTDEEFAAEKGRILA